MTRSTHFDYIIVGAGSAGCVLANKLGEADKGRYSILVIEAGPMDHNLMIHIPAGVYSAWRNPKINWNYQTDPEASLQQRSVAMPRGKVVGGSSSINSMVYMRGHPYDYDRWAEHDGLADWRFDNCLPYFKACESSDRGASGLARWGRTVGRDAGDAMKTLYTMPLSMPVNKPVRGAPTIPTDLTPRASHASMQRDATGDAAALR